MATVNIQGLPKSQVLAALVNRAGGLKLGSEHPRTNQPMSPEVAEEYIAAARKMGNPDQLFFDSVAGRPIRADLTGDSFDPFQFDQEAGEGEAAAVITKLRASLKKKKN